MKLSPKSSRVLFLLFFSALFVVPYLVAGAETSSSTSSSSTSSSTTQTAVLYNPLGTSDVRVVIGRVIQAMLGLSGALALLMFVWGGFQWITSGGEKEKIQKGKNTLIWATIGMFFIFISYTVVYALIRAITSGATS